MKETRFTALKRERALFIEDMVDWCFESGETIEFAQKGRALTCFMMNHALDCLLKLGATDIQFFLKCGKGGMFFVEIPFKIGIEVDDEAIYVPSFAERFDEVAGINND